MLYDMLSKSIVDDIISILGDMFLNDNDVSHSTDSLIRTKLNNVWSQLRDKTIKRTGISLPELDSLEDDVLFDDVVFYVAMKGMQ